MSGPAPGSRSPSGRIIDLTHAIRTSMPVYPADPRPALLPWTRAALHGYESELLHIGTHAGTHVDAPSHFLPGAASVDALPFERLVAPGIVLDVRRVRPRGLIDREMLEAAEAARGQAVASGMAVLLWTGWSDLWRKQEYTSEHPGLGQDGASYLLTRRIALVGIDTINLDCPGDSAFPAHRALLSAGVPIVENLTLLAALSGAGPFTFAAFPLPIVGASGSPVRAVAFLGAAGAG